MPEQNESVIRRAIALLVITGPATLLNLGLTYTASHLLKSEEFGVLYAAITATNILFAPAVVVNLFFSRYVSTALSKFGADAAQPAFFAIVRTILRWLAVATPIGIVAALLFGGLAGGFSPSVGTLIVVIVATCYFAECGRVILQGEHRFLNLGLYTLLWMVCRFVLGVGALWLFGTVWGGLIGIALSGPVAFALFFYRNILGWRRVERSLLPAAPALLAMLPLALGYAIYSAAAHADILSAYLVLNPMQLGVYSASSVLPKGMLVATLPIIQLAFPMMVGRHAAARPGATVLIKGIGLTLAVAVAGVIAIFVISGPACSATYGLQGCDATTMMYAALAMVPFSLLRFFVAADYSSDRDWLPSLLIVPTVIFLGVLVGVRVTPTTLAMYFLIFSVATLLPYPLLRYVQSRLSLRKAPSP